MAFSRLLQASQEVGEILLTGGVAATAGGVGIDAIGFHKAAQAWIETGAITGLPGAAILTVALLIPRPDTVPPEVSHEG